MRFFAMTDGVTSASLSPLSDARPSQRASLEFRTQSTYIENGRLEGGRCMETLAAVTLNLMGEDLNVLGEVLQTAKAGLEVEIQHTFHRLYRDELRRRLTVIEHLIDCCRGR
jgi:hypothetical protein